MMHTHTRWHVAAGVLAGVIVILAPRLAASDPVNCLPPKSCSGVEQCCTFPHGDLYRVQMEGARFNRDWYGDKCNMAAAKTCTSNVSGIGPEENSYFQETWGSILRAMFNAAEDAQKFSVPEGDGPFIYKRSLHTDPSTCKTHADKQDNDPPGSSPQDLFDKQTTCSEFLDAAREHEEEHRDFCEARNMPNSPLAAKYGSPTGAPSTAESERRSYAREYYYLLKNYEDAHRKCSRMQKKLTPDEKANAKKAIKDARDALNKGKAKQQKTCPPPAACPGRGK